jgi:hypothetical protein
MDHLPVQDGAQLALRVDEEVSGAVVAVHHGDPLGRWGRMSAQPADGSAPDRLGAELVFVEDVLPAVELTRPAIGWRDRLHVLAQA